MTFTRTAEEIARDEYDEALWNSPEAQAFLAAEAEAAHLDAYEAWKQDRAEDDPEADLSIEAFNDSLEAYLED